MHQTPATVAGSLTLDKVVAELVNINVGLREMNVELMEQYIWIGCWTVIGLALASIILVGGKPGKRLWTFVFPFVATLAYIPYEAYFHIPEVSLGVPIRVDLLLIIPLFEAMFVTGLISAIAAVRKSDHPISFPMAVVMGVLSISWPIYVATFLMGIGT